MIIDLTIYIKSILHKQYTILLFIDANEFLVSKSGVAKLINETGLIDHISLKHGILNEPKTHKRGSSRIDFAFFSRFLNQYIKLYGITPFVDISVVDHREIFDDIDTCSFFKEILKPQQPFSRLLSTKN